MQIILFLERKGAMYFKINRYKVILGLIVFLCAALVVLGLGLGNSRIALAAEQAPNPEISEEEIIANTITSIFHNLDGIQNHYNQGVSGMGQTTADPGGIFGFLPTSNAKMARLVYAPFTQTTPHITDSVPEGFQERLDSSGSISAPAGACGAGAWAQAIFVTNGQEAFWMDSRSVFLGRRVYDIIDHHRRPRVIRKMTPQENPLIVISGDLLEEAQLSNIDFEILIGEGDESLNSILMELISPTDMRLLTSEGWNEAVWEPLAEYQEPAESLMDYHLWSISPQLEQIVLDEIQAQLETMGVPGVVMDAFENSDRYGWFAKPESQPEDGLSYMFVEAEFSGDLQGTIYEERDFTFPDPGDLPEFGEMLGAGEITYNHPDLGSIEFDLGIQWTGWDEMGRVNVGKAYLYNSDLDYAIEMNFNEDGTKTGEVIVGGEPVGEITLSVEGTSTYIQHEE